MKSMDKNSRGSILKILRKSGDFVRGKELCDTLNISRQAVWKNIQNLQAAGYIIESRKYYGYRLAGEPEGMTGPGIQSYITTDKVHYTVKYFKTVDSTNTELVRRASGKGATWTVAVADRQTDGMGRRGRGFVSAPDSGIYMSILLRPKMDPADISAITLVAAMAICDTLNENIRKFAPESGKKVGIKWPNDVILDGKKVCGILTQMNCESSYINYVITGFGLNINNEKFPEEIADRAMSLYIATGVKFDREIITAGILDNFAEYYTEFIKSGDMTPFLDKYNEMMIDTGSSVDIYGGLVEETPAEKVRHGIAKGINKDGSLIVEIDGKLQSVYSGEVSVRRAASEN